MELSEILALPMVFLVDSLHKGSIVFIIVFFILPFVLAYSVGESRSEKHVVVCFGCFLGL